MSRLWPYDCYKRDHTIWKSRSYGVGREFVRWWGGMTGRMVERQPWVIGRTVGLDGRTVW